MRENTSDSTFYRRFDIDRLKEELQNVKLENDHLNNTVVVLQQQLLLERSEKEMLKSANQDLSKQLVTSAQNRLCIRPPLSDALNGQSNSVHKATSPLKDLLETSRKLTESDIQTCNKDFSSRVALKYLLKKQNSDDQLFLLSDPKNMNKTSSHSKLKTIKQVRNQSFEGSEILKKKIHKDRSPTQTIQLKKQQQQNKLSTFKKPVRN